MRFSPSPEQEATDAFRAKKKYADLFNREQDRVNRGNTMQSVTQGIPASALPPGNPRMMSEADQKNTARRAGRRSLMLLLPSFAGAAAASGVLLC